MSEGEREGEGERERNACYKAKSCLFGALGQKQEPAEPTTVSIILLDGVSVSVDAGC